MTCTEARESTFLKWLVHRACSVMSERSPIGRCVTVSLRETC
ncbi:hypothetical protein Enr13x_09420 [Stieleria neptunia]|uniref:Uncharacterized protein n=1 Tax=Stieleria neptunia TaxID=2527979 RepID=A0A518HJS4_9BACT|nr:hypothetical protein Enr13x_09420 [Stieleria neptunia]